MQNNSKEHQLYLEMLNSLHNSEDRLRMERLMRELLSQDENA
jgi:hypothetical protein